MTIIPIIIEPGYDSALQNDRKSYPGILYPYFSRNVNERQGNFRLTPINGAQAWHLRRLRTGIFLSQPRHTPSSQGHNLRMQPPS